MTRKERFGLTWKLYIPPVICGTATIACIVCANQIGTRRTVAMAAAYTISENAFTEYKEKIVDKLGEGKERAVRDEIAQDQVTRTPYPNNQVIISGQESLCLDTFSGRYFTSSMEAIRKAQNDVNETMLSDHSASLGDFYEKVGIPPNDQSEELGWTLDNMLHINFSTTLTDTGQPCLAITFRTEPIRNHWKF